MPLFGKKKEKDPAVEFEFEEIAVAHAKGAELSVETAVSGIDIPFHPGATKYFTEVGAM